ncbi:kinetochore protein Spc25, fungi type [Entomortierella parvispora]|uniref:Kinetochore protein SPC25 n=1 Tax=Entomortierella parvispora TaxID=205924 RepID=A0A9P3LSS4_9FUNG|nr:kinetochore protein Spc25, fungi type [Entomortierella parvispora]
MAATAAPGATPLETASSAAPARTSLSNMTRTSLGNGRTSFGTGLTHTFIDSANRLSTGSHRHSLMPALPKSAQLPLLDAPQFDSEELTARALTFINEVNSSAQKFKTKISNNTEQWISDTSEIRESDRDLREALKLANSEEVALAQALRKEKMEAQNMARAIQDLSIRHEEMKQIQESLQEQVIILRREVKAKREAKIAQKKALDEQVLKNRPELASYESVLSMRIVGVKEDHIAFVFTRINERDWEQEFSFTIDVSNVDYAVYDCSPLLPDLESLVRYLNDTRDFYGFLKKARKAFQEVAKDMPKN